MFVDVTGVYDFIDIDEFELQEETPIYDLADYTAVYDFNWFVVDIAVHAHVHFVIPIGVIDGINKTFKVGGRQFEVMLNGLNHPYTSIIGGFVLDSAPRPGDFLWCDTVI